MGGCVQVHAYAYGGELPPANGRRLRRLRLHWPRKPAWPTLSFASTSAVKAETRTFSNPREFLIRAIDADLTDPAPFRACSATARITDHVRPYHGPVSPPWSTYPCIMACTSLPPVIIPYHAKKNADSDCALANKC
jgi:hypothetical protein